jgi:hypothetical protein
MKDCLLRYLISFLVVIVLGYYIPSHIPICVFVDAIVAAVVLTEGVGLWGFGTAWSRYRLILYLVYTLPIFCFLIGLFICGLASYRV